jgi:hypothetical protein
LGPCWDGMETAVQYQATHRSRDHTGGRSMSYKRHVPQNEDTNATDMGNAVMVSHGGLRLELLAPSDSAHGATVHVQAPIPPVKGLRR